MTDKEKIRAYVKRLQKPEGYGDYWKGYDSALNDILSFIDSMQEEPKGNPFGSTHADFKTAAGSLGISQEESANDDLEQEIQRYYNDMEGDCRYVQTARHFANWQRQQLNKVKEQSTKLPYIIPRETLDEYAYQCAYDLSNDWMKDEPTWDDIETACKLGANWHKQQMMKNVTYGEVSQCATYPYNLKIQSIKTIDKDLKVGDKVKLIIIKED